MVRKLKGVFIIGAETPGADIVVYLHIISVDFSIYCPPPHLLPNFFAGWDALIPPGIGQWVHFKDLRRHVRGFTSLRPSQVIESMPQDYSCD